jgi:hypothetical protein
VPLPQDDGAEGEASGDGESGGEPEEDPSLIRHIIETVESTVDDLPA